MIGNAKSGDFAPHLILDGYQAMLDYGIYPQGKVVLASFITYPRFAGPREAVFTALCRKNMGCSHFIIGRDHTGVGGFYGANANRELFDELGDIGIEPIFFDAVGYDTQSERYVDVNACETATADQRHGDPARLEGRRGAAELDDAIRGAGRGARGVDDETRGIPGIGAGGDERWR